jgi:hypothetical protein
LRNVNDGTAEIGQDRHFPNSRDKLAETVGFPRPVVNR